MWDLNFGTWISHRGFTVAEGHGHPLVYLKNALLICWGVVGGGKGVYMGYGLNGYILIPWL